MCPKIGIEFLLYVKHIPQDSSEKSDSPIEAQPLWEYFGRALCSTFEIATFDLTQDVNSEDHVSISSTTSFQV